MIFTTFNPPAVIEQTYNINMDGNTAYGTDFEVIRDVVSATDITTQIVGMNGNLIYGQSDPTYGSLATQIPEDQTIGPGGLLPNFTSGYLSVSTGTSNLASAAGWVTAADSSTGIGYVGVEYSRSDGEHFAWACASVSKGRRTSVARTPVS